jgi:hypothetical protein
MVNQVIDTNDNADDDIDQFGIIILLLGTEGNKV